MLMLPDTKILPQGDFMDMSSVPGPSGQQRAGSGFLASTPADQERKANGMSQCLLVLFCDSRL